MTNNHNPRLHRSPSADGTEIAARVHGQGPPLVFLPAGPGDSHTSWGQLMPRLREQFTCYLMDTRGRGLSADHPDHAPERLVEDVVTFAESIGEPAGLVGWGDVLWANVAAAGSPAIAAVAGYEPGVDAVMSAEMGERLVAAFERMGNLAAAGKMVDAARVFIENSDMLYTREDLDLGVPLNFWEASAPYLSIFLRQESLAAERAQSSPTAPESLSKISVPVLILQGTQTTPWFIESARYLAEHVADIRVVPIEGASHYGPHTHTNAVAQELLGFFTTVWQPRPTGRTA
jgi:pimeloyl-ACP methyl ester carboxylesterase